MDDDTTYDGESALTNEHQLIGDFDQDTPIYRIFPLWYLEEALRINQLVLVPPDKWDDPFETICRQIAVDRWDEERFITQVFLNQSLPLAFAQCWSATAESDTLLRAYSRVAKDTHFNRNTCPRDEGVQVKSTPRKLLRALAAAVTSSQAGHCYMGQVRYLTENALLQEITDLVGQYGDDVFYDPLNHANLLLMKRAAFSHEAELRLIYVQNHLESSQSLLRVRIDPNEVFDEITFDPRLETFERREREAVIQDLGYTGRTGQSSMYQRPFLQVILGRSAPSPAPRGGQL